MSIKLDGLTLFTVLLLLEPRLGLAIARQLVELHGGDIQVDSPGEGQGAVFTVVLPLVKNSAPPLYLR